MGKINGRNIRVYQSGEIIKLETECSYSESLEFVAVKVNKDMDIDINKSKNIQVKFEDKVLLDMKFDFLDIVTDAEKDALTTDLLIFHNGNIDIVLEYLNVGVWDSLNYRLNRLEQLINNPKKFKYFDLIEKRAMIGHDNQSKLELIPMWIRRIFKAN